MAVVKWTFLDTVTSETYTFEVNPTTPINIAYVKNVDANALGAGGGVVISEKETPPEVRFSGTVLTETEYNAFVAWWGKEVPVTITDDLAQTFTVAIRDFIPKRKFSTSHPWAHSYEVVALPIIP